MTVTPGLPVAHDPHADEVAIRSVLAALDAAHAARDGRAICALLTPDAVVYDLAPPLVSAYTAPEAIQAWLDGWDGPVRLVRRDLVVTCDGDLALAHGLTRTDAARGGEAIGWWMRETFGLRRTPDGWRISHQHQSVPFLMDGSNLAAVALEP